MSKEYENSTAGYLDHYVGNILNLAVNYHTSAEIREYLGSSYLGRARLEFCESLEKSLALPEFYGVTHQHIQDMLHLASGNWNDQKVLRALYQRYEEIRKMGIDINHLFEEDT